MDCCLVVPPGSYRPERVAEAIRLHHGDEVGVWAVWCGEPTRRPAPSPGTRWADLDLPEPTGVGWGRLRASVPPAAYAWARSAAATRRLIAARGRPVLVLHVGAAGVTGRLDDWWPDGGVAMIARDDHIPLDGLAPTMADLARDGRWGTAALGVSVAAAGVLDDLVEACAVAGAHDRVGPIVGHVVADHDVVTPASGLAAGWSTSEGPVSLVDLGAVDVGEPWVAQFPSGRPRHRWASVPHVAAAVETAALQAVGEPGPVTVAGGVVVDDAVRALVADAVQEFRRGGGPLPPDPDEPGVFVDWLLSPWVRSGSLGRYWFELWATRPDLQFVFPDPLAADRERFLEWAHASWRSDGRSPLLEARREPPVARWDHGGREPGINVIGYASADSGLGDFTRRLARSIADADVPLAVLDYARNASPHAADTPELATAAPHRVNLLTVHGDQVRFLVEDHGANLLTDRRTIGYWFWELSQLSERAIAAIDLVDEVWVATEFVADAYRRVTDKPVRVVPVPVPEPVASSATRAELGLPDDRFVFLVTFDHLSITERKNPLAAIAAFRSAFPESRPDGPVLVIKTLNGDQRWVEHERLLRESAARDDIMIVDRQLDRADQMRLIELADCLVSLHRSEGLGLHLLEAMWLETPVIATRYSGNLDAMNDSNSVLIDADLVPVVDRQRYYPTDAVWAEPRHDDAVAALRAVVADPELGRRLARQARHDMEHQPSLEETGRTIARLVGESSETEIHA